ncbi:MAG: hypothetical protein ACI8P0_000049 [Planctomycetaceae bacterium]|jgi:hypothetical protein
MADEQSFVTDLRGMIAQKQVTVVIGSGVSVATTSKAPSWRGLIESAVDELAWADRIRRRVVQGAGGRRVVV